MLILDLLDRFIELTRVRNKRRKAIFEEIIRPTFGEIEKIHSDYLSTFTSCLQMVEDQDAIGKIITTIEDKRRPLLPVRQKVQALVKAYSPARSNERPYEMEETLFIEAVAKYFGLTHTWGTLQSETLDILRSLEEKAVDTGYGIHVPIASKADILEYRRLDENEKTFFSYGVMKYIYSKNITEQDERRKILYGILSRQIAVLGDRWSKLCYAYAELQYAAASLDV